MKKICQWEVFKLILGNFLVRLTYFRLASGELFQHLVCGALCFSAASVKLPSPLLEPCQLKKEANKKTEKDIKIFDFI